MSINLLNAQAPSWGAAGLENENLVNPTSLDFGPNGKLYVSQQDGLIWEYTVERDNAPAGEGSYTVKQGNVITLIKNNTQNHNDDGNLNNTKIRQITGILATGTAENPVLYVTSSDWRIGGKNQPGNDVNLDTNSGVLSRLTWNGNNWDKVELVRGLPRCEENHSTNGMELFTKNGNQYLFIQQGGNTNQGAPSNNFAGSSEYFLAGALLIVNLTQLENIEQSNGGPFTDLRDNNSKYIYDLPTLNDPERPDIDNSSPDFPYGPGHPLYNATIDKGDPFGGNNGLNQSFPEPNGPVQIFSPGYRNAYDIVVTAKGDIYTFDNGPNGGWGGPPLIRTQNGSIKGDDYSTSFNPGSGDYVTNEFNYSNGKTHSDQLHYVGNINDPNNTYYAGHPVPIRAFPSKAEVIEYEYNGNEWIISKRFNWAELIEGVSGYFQQNFSMNDFPDDPRQGFYTTDEINNPDLNMLDFVPSSTNGMCEYTASNFNNQLKGNLFAASFNGNINRYVIEPNNHTLIEKNNTYLSGFGSIPLDVIAQGDDEIFPGTIWAATYGEDNITIFEPADFGQCFSPDEEGYDPEADYDKDGFSNADEVANQTDHCSAGSKPADADGDFISDLIDTDDDNDGIPDKEDTFALDPLNGTGTDLPITYPFWNNDPGTGMFGLGFTGLMLDPSGQTDYLETFDPENMSFGGAGGKATIDFTTPGDALEQKNNQDYAFQFGVNVDENSNPFTVHTKIETPFNGERPLEGQSYGAYIGTGDQDNYLKVVLMNGSNQNDNLDGIAIVLETQGNTEIQIIDIPGILGAIGVDLYMGINPKTKTMQASYSLDNGQTVLALGNELLLPDNFFTPDDNHGLAVGIISTAGNSGVGFTATWDFLNVTEDQPNTLTANPDAIDFGITTINSNPSGISLELFNLGGNEDPVIEITDLKIINDAEQIFSVNQNLPISIGTGVIQQIPVTITPNDITGKKTGDLEITHSGINSPLVIPLSVELENAKIEEPIVRINAGALTNFLATDGGPVWEATASNGFYKGSFFEVNTGINYNTQFSYNLRHESIPSYVDQPSFNEIFSHERFDSASGEEMKFSIPLKNDTYAIRIYLGTNFNGTSEIGSREFDILVEGQVVKPAFDPVLEFGFGKAGMLEFPVNLQDGNLNISFTHITENPNIYAIEVLGYSLFNGVNAQALAFPVKGTAPLEVAFNGSGSSAFNNLESYEWDFGDNSSSTEINPIHTFTSSGKYTVTLTVSDGKNQDTDTLTITVDEPVKPEDFALLINAGGEEITYNGKIFKQDQYFNGGDIYNNKQAEVPNIYRTERNSSESLSYGIPVTNGTYELNLHFAEIYFGANGGFYAVDPGQRVFDVYIEDSLVLDNYDILKEVGPETPDIRTFTQKISDGEINIFLTSSFSTGGVGSAKISALEIYGLDPNGKFSPLVVESIPDQYNDEGETPNLSINASGGDPSENFTYSISGQPRGINIEPTNGMVFGVVSSGARTEGPNSDGVYNVTITVSKTGSQPVQTEFTWTITPALNEWFNKDENENYTARHECSFVQAGQSFFLMGGRENANSVDVYDYQNNNWSNLDNNTPFEFNHFQAVEYQGYIWVIGAFQTNSYPNEIPAESIWIFNPLTYEWKKGPDIPESRRRGSSGLVVYNDKFYIVGGNTDGHDGGYVPYFDSYDPITGEWNVLPDAPHARDHFHAVLADNKLYAIGGRLSGGNGGVFTPIIPEVDVYDFNTNSWETLDPSSNIPTPRAGAITVNFKNKIYVAGGEVNNSPEAFKITEIFDPVSQQWTVGDDMNHNRHGTQGIVSGNGIFVAGGSPVKGGGNQKNMEYYNYDTPSGIKLINSKINLPSQVVFKPGETKIIETYVRDGNMAILPDSLTITGSSSNLFKIENVTLPELIKSNSTITFEITYTGEGQFDAANFTLYYNNDQKVSVNLTSNDIPNTLELIPILRINTGGEGIVSMDEGPDWFPDNKNGTQKYDDFTVNGGSVYNGTDLNYFDKNGSIPNYIDKSTFEQLFSSEKYNAKSELKYSIPVVNGTYVVNLYFGTSFEKTSSVGDRLFSITLEKEVVDPQFDVIKKFGFKIGGMFSKEVLVEDGELNIDLKGIVQNPFINGIEILIDPRNYNEPPIAKISTDKNTGYNPLSVSFSARQSTDDYGINTYAWDLGNGDIASGQDLNYTFEEPGEYLVTLTIADRYGLTGTDTTTIKVIERPEPDLVSNRDTLDFGKHIIDGEIANMELILTNPSQEFNGINNISSISIRGEDAFLFEHEFEIPASLNTASSIAADITFNPATQTIGKKKALLQVVHNGENSPLEIILQAEVINNPELKPLYRINVGGDVTVKANDNGPDWEKNPDDGYYLGTYYEVFGGKNNKGELNYSDRNSSIPPYLDESTYLQLYSTERNVDMNDPQMEFEIIVPNGDYVLNIYLGREDENNVVYDLSVENVEIKNLDLGKLISSKQSAMMSIPATVTDDRLNFLINVLDGTYSLFALEVLSAKNVELEDLITFDDERGNIALNIFPNPAAEEVNFLYGNSGIPLKTIQLFDLNGRLIKGFDPSALKSSAPLSNKENSRLYTLPLEGLSRGLYILSLENDNGDQKKAKLVISKPR
ncbi:malectin domain-containing carbohydrate-binding protein [Robertkochia flava]|uniref:malectin domain-containing carbohydrate-binding protein n=1 Tax=Robertkochia flava TaxID=3447986 RepID=UPI001CCA6D40|nr:malectin domain-containing carbohydrate-binding protein [Robertkochia marina]